MTDYKSKQQLMMGTALSLHQNGEFLCVPHCSYYACIQLISFIWYEKLGKTEAELNQKAIMGGQKSHNVMNNAAAAFILQSKKTNARNDMDLFNTKIGQLKGIRNRYDYKEVDITFDDSKKATEYADDIIKILKRYL